MKACAEAFLAAVRENDPGLEAFALYQNGKILLEEHFAPDFPRLIYSHTKSFVATAAGFCLDEGRISLDTKFLDLYPEYRSVVVDPSAEEITLRHLLTMTSGLGEAYLMIGRHNPDSEGLPDYLAYLMSRPLKYRPGEHYVYSNGDSHMIAAMVRRATGETLQRYLYRKLFHPLGIGYPMWEADPDGLPFGGSGLFLKVRDMMKLGILYLNDGVWNGERLLSSHWVTEATRRQVCTGTGDPWTDGYGYQFWMSSHPGVFRCDGAYGQFSIVLPEEKAVVGIQCSERNTGMDMIRLIQKHFPV